MIERLIAGWGVRLVDQPCSCDGRGLRPDGDVCACDAGKRLRVVAQAQADGERKVLAGRAGCPVCGGTGETSIALLSMPPQRKMVPCHLCPRPT